LHSNAGCNLLTQTPEILTWLKTVYPEKDLIIGCYVYLDGEAHVRVSIACDAIMSGMVDHKKAGTVSLGYLCTPTDVHVVPMDSRKAAISNFNSTSWENLLLMPLRAIVGGRYLVKNFEPTVKAKDGTEFAITDALAVAQGPNYALAKRLQHWRAIISRSKGAPVSTNIAPSSATASVVSNKQFAWVYDGLPYFKPMEIMQQETSNYVMAALLINDIRDKTSVAYPNRPLANPYQLFSSGSFHGGMWRCGYKLNTIGEIAAVIHFIKVGKPVIFLLLIVILVILFRTFF